MKVDQWQPAVLSYKMHLLEFNDRYKAMNVHVCECIAVLLQAPAMNDSRMACDFKVDALSQFGHLWVLSCWAVSVLLQQPALWLPGTAATSPILGVGGCVVDP